MTSKNQRGDWWIGVLVLLVLVGTVGLWTSYAVQFRMEPNGEMVSQTTVGLLPYLTLESRSSAVDMPREHGFQLHPLPLSATVLLTLITWSAVWLGYRRFRNLENSATHANKNEPLFNEDHKRDAT